MNRPISGEHLAAVERMPSGMYLPLNAIGTAIRLVVDATEFHEEQLPALVDTFAEVQLHHPFVKPVFLLSVLSANELSSAGFIYETVMPEASWNRMGSRASYRVYVERRVAEMMHVYMADRVGRLEPGDHVPRWYYERLGRS